MSESTIRENVQYIVENLASAWNGGDRVLDRLAGADKTPHASPLAVARELGDEGLERLFGDEEGRRELQSAVESLHTYLARQTWFDRAAPQDPRLDVLRQHPVAYFCAEFGLADWLSIYSGGLGILAGDVLKEASDMGLPFVGIGLFYRRGFFYQQLDQNSYQTETAPTLDPADLPLKRARDANGNEIVISVCVADRTVCAAVWQLEVGRTTLYLLDTDTPENERESDRAITAMLYGGDQETRIQQEIVLGIGGVRLLRTLGIDASIYGMNEGHAAFLALELLSEALRTMDFEAARAWVRNRVVYTNHTVVPAGNDVFPVELVSHYLSQYIEESHIGWERLLQLMAAATGFSMPILAFQLAGKANAVSEIHATAIAREWPGFPIEVVTNGVHVPTWAGREVTSLLERYVPDWRGDDPEWEQIEAIPAGDLWETRAQQRRAMLQFVSERVPNAHFSEDALTLVWARRFAEYKRAGLLARDLARLERIMSDWRRPVQLVISGKAHPRDEGAKHLMQGLLQELEKSPTVAPHVAFVPDYSMAVGQALTAGADVWVNTPRKPLEASGTSGMKSSDNGGLQLTVRDGWAAEVDWWDVGWGIEGRDDATDAGEMYYFLEESIVPCFYTRDESGVPKKWVDMMKATMRISLSRYSARRMVLDYVNKLYLPLIEEQGAQAPAPSVP